MPSEILEICTNDHNSRRISGLTYFAMVQMHEGTACKDIRLCLIEAFVINRSIVVYVNYWHYYYAGINIL